jgi:hypothetical protein
MIQLNKEVHQVKTKQTACCIFLVRQGLRARSEQFIGIAKDRASAIQFCRHTTMTKCYSDNIKYSIHTVDTKTEEDLNVNFATDKLLIKGIDFSRRDEGRINSNPLWYWNISDVTFITTL